MGPSRHPAPVKGAGQLVEVIFRSCPTLGRILRTLDVDPQPGGSFSDCSHLGGAC